VIFELSFERGGQVFQVKETRTREVILEAPSRDQHV
jgi:hypothetical protein